LLGRAESVSADSGLNAQMDALIQNAIRTSEIEGEHLDAGSVRSSVARQLGVEQAALQGMATPKSDSLVALLLEATGRPDEPLTLAQLCHWQAMLFPEGGSVLRDINVGTLRGEQTMQVVSGRSDKPKIHFEAPPRQGLEQELERFLKWF